MTRPPAVDALARDLASSGLPHPILVDVARSVISELGSSASGSDALDGDAYRLAGLEAAQIRSRQLLAPVINATGVLLHTNLGRAPVSHSQGPSFSNLEQDMASGRRGSRQRTIGQLISETTGAEAGMVVNNCASALMLALAALAGSRGAAVSRSELVEIGGGFRVPDVMRQSGAQLIEVGTTNRTRLADFRRAAETSDVALVLSVHRSNYTISGFAEDASIQQLRTLGIPVVADIGSGLLDAACPWLKGGPPGWLKDEPAAKQTLDAGADLVMFSGDKLLGGPQAGILAGRADLVAACAAHPLARALRPGGLVLGALQATLLAYLRKDGDAIPFWKMAATPVDELRNRAAALGVGTVVDTFSVPGGGTLPEVTMPSAGVSLAGDHTEALRNTTPPIIARVLEGRTVLDLRTVDPSEDPHVRSALHDLTGTTSNP